MADEAMPSAMPTGYMQDAAGRLVPLANIRPEDLLEDELVRRLYERGCQVQEALRKLRADAFEEVAILQVLLAEKHGAKVGGPKGNLTLSSYDGSRRLQVAVGDSITFGPELATAKQLIDECLEQWTEGGDPNIKAIITDAFDVRKQGKVQVGQILRLRRLHIDHPIWKRAMEALSAAIRIDCTTSYVRFYERARPDAPHELLQLNIAKA